ncbi:MAG: hypothetical protein HOQ24_17075 [Mycobacteriaceae bacterium]|nr:hypothetical protein [Mycobacteriaceae bacterium]
MTAESHTPADTTLDRPRRTTGRDDACRYSWADLDIDAAEQLWRDLGDWVDWLRHRYQLGSRVPACWYRHGTAVETLTALMAAHHAAYLPGPDRHDTAREDLIAWHQQWLWPTVDQLTRVSDFSGCGPGRCGYRTQPQLTHPGFDDFVHTDLTERPAPGLTPAAPVEPIGPDLVGDEDMAELIATHSAQSIQAAGRTIAVRYDGRVWVYSRIAGAWIPERGGRRRP